MCICICSPGKLFLNWLEKSCHCVSTSRPPRKTASIPLANLPLACQIFLEICFHPLPTHTNTLHTHAFYKTLSVRELFWETSLRPQANTGSTPLYTKFQGPSLTGLLTQSSSLLFLDYTFGCLMGMEGDHYLKEEKREDNAQV